MREIALRIFGTKDYEAVLSVLPPHDGTVRKFYREVNKLNSEGDGV